ATLAASIVAGLAVGGLRYADGKLQHMAAFGELELLTLPDGSQVMTGAVPTGELEAVRRASGAAFVLTASSMVPASPFLRNILPPAALLFRLGPLRDLATWMLAGVVLKPVRPDAEYSFVQARIEWPSGLARQGWLRAGDAMAFTAAAAVEIVLRLSRDEVRPGAYTPGALFGPELAIEAGGEFLSGHDSH
ncbi:MAG: hypothetical protein KGO02_22230, partial [Alphaproteobacteria bacterium]|nr:hypothetical protein [Alphaproteobacteria bacterium]